MNDRLNNGIIPFPSITGSQEAIRLALGHLDQAFTIFDANFTLIGFNSRVHDLLDLPENIIFEGAKLEDIFRFNAERGEYGSGKIDEMVAARMAMAKEMRPHMFERVRPDGAVLQVKGTPLPTGGFVTTYTDMTEQRLAEEELRANEERLRATLEASPVGVVVSRASDGLLLYVNSPGGGVTDSDRIYQAIRRFRNEHPEVAVCALFGDMAASGGYYVGVAAEQIFARRTGITGSIGVIMSAWNFAELAKEHGVEQVAIKSDRTPYKDMLSPTRKMTDAERAMLTGIVDEFYDQFVDVVVEGRGMPRDDVVRAANGGIYTARQAVDLGLVDALGDHLDVVAWFEGKLGHEVTIVERRRRPGLGDLLFGSLTSARATGPLDQLLTSSTGPRFLYYWQGGR